MQNLRQPLQLGTTNLFRTQLYEFLSNIPHEYLYSQTCPMVGGSCGQHVRHVLDHFECVTSNFDSVSSYDTFRNRNSTLETSLEISKTKLDELEQRTKHIINNENLNQCIQVWRRARRTHARQRDRRRCSASMASTIAGGMQ